MFLNTHYENYTLGDINPDLINLYLCLKREPKGFVKFAKDWFTPKENTEAAYYHWRKVFNSTECVRTKSALFLYINRHGYNGLCRYNSKGEMNVPFGRYKRPYYPSDEMYQFAERAKHARFVCAPFDKLMNRARRGDVVYCDPPYVPLSDSANFTSYAKEGFGLDDQMALAVKAHRLAERGVSVLISNHENALTRELYEHAEISRFQVRRSISCKGALRTKAWEILALYKGE